MKRRSGVWLTLIVALLVGAGCGRGATPTATPSPAQISVATLTPTVTAVPAPTPTPSPPPPSLTPAPSTDPFELISQDSLFAFLEDLTAIQPYSGWRNSASEGEAEALNYVAGRLDALPSLRGLGLELERQSFPVFLGTELWDTRLLLTVDGQEVEVPADGLRGPRDEIPQALRFDSDGRLNDAERDPVAVKGPIVVVRSPGEIRALRAEDVRDAVVFLDYAIIDRTVMATSAAEEVARQLLSLAPAGLVLVTQFSTEVGVSHGFAVGDASVLNSVETETTPPTLYVRLEDLAPAGIADWDDLARVEAAHIVWDADLFSPAESGNLVARIPGVDPSRAAILGAHIDSANNPGAMDDGSGSVVLLEVARVLDAAQVQPPVDLYLAWFGSEELNLYGSSHFVLTHQELLDRTVAMLQIDCLMRPLDGIDAQLNLVAWSYARLGDGRLPWPQHLAQAASRHQVAAFPVDAHRVYSDNTPFSGFDVPNADLIYLNDVAMEAAGGLHNAGHIHGPYDTVALAREVGDVLEEMARVALTAALEAGREDPALRVAPPPERRALFVGSHTEPVQVPPNAAVELGMALAWEGFDVDFVPRGQALTAADLEDVTLVVALPVVDYPGPDGDPDLYDEAWTQEEVDLLALYVERGGLLVMGNSAHRLKYGNQVMESNEDWEDANALAARFGVTFGAGTVNSASAQPEGQHTLMHGVGALELAGDNGVPFEMSAGQVLARAGGLPFIGLVDHGHAGGQVLVLADVSVLGAGYGRAGNLTFWQNLARYARERGVTE